MTNIREAFNTIGQFAETAIADEDAAVQSAMLPAISAALVILEQAVTDLHRIAAAAERMAQRI
jgi:hypothetical protein